MFVLKNYSYDGNKILLYKFGGTYRLYCSFYNLKDWVKSKGTREYIFNTFDEAETKANSLITHLGNCDFGDIAFNNWPESFNLNKAVDNQTNVCQECGEIHGQESYPFEGAYTGLRKKQKMERFFN